MCKCVLVVPGHTHARAAAQSNAYDVSCRDGSSSTGFWLDSPVIVSMTGHKAPNTHTHIVSTRIHGTKCTQSGGGGGRYMHIRLEWPLLDMCIAGWCVHCLWVWHRYWPHMRIVNLSQTFWRQQHIWLSNYPTVVASRHRRHEFAHKSQVRNKNAILAE